MIMGFNNLSNMESKSVESNNAVNDSVSSKISKLFKGTGKYTTAMLSAVYLSACSNILNFDKKEENVDPVVKGEIESTTDKAMKIVDESVITAPRRENSVIPKPSIQEESSVIRKPKLAKYSTVIKKPQINQKTIIKKPELLQDTVIPTPRLESDYNYEQPEFEIAINNDVSYTWSFNHRTKVIILNAKKIENISSKLNVDKSMYARYILNNEKGWGFYVDALENKLNKPDLTNDNKISELAWDVNSLRWLVKSAEDDKIVDAMLIFFYTRMGKLRSEHQNYALINDVTAEIFENAFGETYTREGIKKLFNKIRRIKTHGDVNGDLDYIKNDLIYFVNSFENEFYDNTWKYLTAEQNEYLQRLNIFGPEQETGTYTASINNYWNSEYSQKFY